MLHKLEIVQATADAIIEGKRTFDFCINDRGYNAGDEIQYTVKDGYFSVLHPIMDRTYVITYAFPINTDRGIMMVFSIQNKEDLLKKEIESLGKKIDSVRDQLNDLDLDGDITKEEGE